MTEHDDAARGEAGDIAEEVDHMVADAAPIDWARVEALADRLAALARRETTEVRRPG